MTITTIVFDIGAVLLRWQPYELLEELFPGESIAMYPQIMGHSQWSDLDAGIEDEAVAIVDFAGRTGKTIEEITFLMNEVRNHLSPLPESVELFNEVKCAGYTTYVLSNMPSYLMEHYRGRDTFWDSFDGIMCSSYENLLKPSPAIFKRLFETFDIEAHEALFIDDMKKNITASKESGMDGIVFENAKQCRRELIARGISIKAS